MMAEEIRDQYYENIVGKASAEEKGDILSHEREYFTDSDKTNIGDYEREKTQDENVIIDIVRNAVDELYNSTGAPRFDVPSANFHIIPENKWPERVPDQMAAMFIENTQQILLKEQSSKLSLAAKAFHEYLHMKSYGAIQILEDDSTWTYRGGLTVIDRQGNRRMFNLLNEALTEELVMSLVNAHKDNELFTDETRETERLREKYESFDDLKEFFNDDLYSVKEGIVNDQHVFIGEKFTYPQERQALNSLVQKISERDQTNREIQDIRQDFISAYFTGDILPIGKMIDRNFGKGTFRTLGSFDERTDLLDYVNSL